MKIAYWVFLLILVYLLVSYYKGTSAVIGAGGGQLQNFILYLQGRNSAGVNANYPS